MGRAGGGGTTILGLPFSISATGALRESTDAGTGSLFNGFGVGAENSLGIAGMANLGSGFSFGTFGSG